MNASHAAGETTPALLDDTIYDNLLATARAHPGRGGPGVAPSRAALQLRRFRGGHGRGGPRADGPGRPAGRPGGDLESQPGRVGAGAVRHGGDRGDPREHQPGLPHLRAGVRAAPVGRVAAGVGSQPRHLGLRSPLRRGGRPGPHPAGDLARRRAPRARRLGGVAGTGRKRRRRRAATASHRAARRGPHQHPVHQRHDRVPEGRHPHAPQHPEQRVLLRRTLPLPPPPTGSASRFPSTTASAWCSATWPAPPTAPA